MRLGNLRGVAVNVFMTVVLACGAYNRFKGSLPALGMHNLSEFVLGIQFSTMALFFLFRCRASLVSWRLRDVAATLLSLFTPLFFWPVPFNSAGFSGAGLQIAGSVFALLGMLSLNRSIGVLPANRGIRTGGMFALVRHPVYAGYQLSYIGYTISNASLYNLTVMLLCLVSQVLRIASEERLLARDPAYREYSGKVRWRMLPFIF